MERDRCGGCEHWKPTPEVFDPYAGYGACDRIRYRRDTGAAVAYQFRDLLDATRELAAVDVVSDGMAGYLEFSHAALLTRHDFGCVLFEPKGPS